MKACVSACVCVRACMRVVSLVCVRTCACVWSACDGDCTVAHCQRRRRRVGFVRRDVRRLQGDADAARACLLLRRLPAGAALLGRLVRLGRGLTRQSLVLRGSAHLESGKLASTAKSP